MADFMVEHLDLAKNKIKNAAQGKMASNRLWNTLTIKLNASGPPIKNCTSWRKVFADQKHQVKLKLSKNKASKRKTGGGPCKELVLTPTDESIILAAGLTAAVEGLSSVKSFGSTSKAICTQLQAKTKPSTKETENARGFEKSGSKGNDLSAQLEKLLESDTDSIMSENSSNTQCSVTVETSNNDVQSSDKPECSSEAISVDPRRKKMTKLSLLEKNGAWRQEKRICIQKSLELKERSLQIKEDEHKSNMAIKQVDLQVKSLQLEILKKQNIEM